MSSPLYCRALNGEPVTFEAVMLVRELETTDLQPSDEGLLNGGHTIAVLGTQLGGGQMVVRAPWCHHAHLTLGRAQLGDLLAVRGVAEEIEAGVGGRVVLVDRPTQVDLWTRVSCSPADGVMNGLLANGKDGS